MNHSWGGGGDGLGFGGAAAHSPIAPLQNAAAALLLLAVAAVLELNQIREVGCPFTLSYACFLCQDQPSSAETVK